MRRSEAATATRALWPKSSASRVPARRQRAAERDGSIAGVLIFCGIGLGLTVIAMLFQWLEMPPPYY